MKIPQINNGKTPDEPYNARLGFWLPPDTPYGNLQLKHLKIVLRIDEANRKIVSAYGHWTSVFGHAPPEAFPRHHLDLESAVFMMRRVADEMIAMHYVLSEVERDGNYPKRIRIDGIGSLLAAVDMLEKVPFKGHRSTLCTLNEVSNAHKHSFIDTNLSMIGGQEPIIYALALHRNKLASRVRFFDVPIAQFVADFQQLYNGLTAWMLDWSNRHMSKASS